MTAATKRTSDTPGRTGGASRDTTGTDRIVRVASGDVAATTAVPDGAPVSSAGPAASTEALAAFLASIRYADLSDTTIEKTKMLFLDWLGSALAGAPSEPVRILARFVRSMGPAGGSATVVPWRATSSPFFAALLNGASSHVVEMDDLHNGAVAHPGTVVFPAALAVAQDRDASGERFIASVVAGYEACVRVGEYLGRSHYRVFHTTATAGILGAAAAAAHLLGGDAGVMQHALGSAGTQAAGLWEFLRDGAMSKQLHAGKAAADGLLAAYLAQDGFTGASRILEGPAGMGAAMSRDADPRCLAAGLTERPMRWKVLETSLKYHASCRHTHPAADALLEVMRRYKLSADDLAAIRVRVYRAASDVLGAVEEPRTIHQAKFSLGFVLALIALYGRAGVADFTEETLHAPAVTSLARRVSMVVDDSLDALYPARWCAVVDVELVDGRIYSSRVDEPKGDPGNPLTAAEVEEKFRVLARAGGLLDERDVEEVIARVRTLERAVSLRDVLPGAAT